MIRRYFARRKMRWAVRRLAGMSPEVRGLWQAQALMRKISLTRSQSLERLTDLQRLDWEKAKRVENFYYKVYDDLIRPSREPLADAASYIITNWRELQDPWEPDD